MSTLSKVLVSIVLAALIFVFGYYLGMQEPSAYDVERLFSSGLQDGKMTIYRGDASSMSVEVEIGDQTDENLEATVTIAESGATYGLSVFQRQAVVKDAAGSPLATAIWDDTSMRVSLLDAAGDTVVSNPLGGKITLKSAHHTSFNPDALALLNGDFVTAVLEAAANWTLLNRHQTNPLVLLTEINDLSEETAESITTTLIEGKLNSLELVDYHHDVLNHGIPREFFGGHKIIINELTEWLRAQSVDGEPLGLPFGRLPYWDPSLPITRPFGTHAAIADSIVAEYPMCSHFRPRVGVPEDYFLMNQPSTEGTHWWPCDPAEKDTWCETRYICEGDASSDTEDPIDACDWIDQGSCPFRIIPRFQPEEICDYSNLQTLWNDIIAWHGDVHIRTGGASGSHPLTPTTPMFWAFHQQIDALYDNWNNCTGGS